MTSYEDAEPSPSAVPHGGEAAAQDAAARADRAALHSLDAQSTPALGAAEVRPSLLGCTPAQLDAALSAHALPAYRSRQIFAAIFARRLASFAQMTDLNKPLRAALGAQFDLSRPRIDACQVATDGTRKYRFVAADRSAFESVYIPDVGGRRTNTLCISSQSGCAVGCKFCFTASIKRNRNLSAAEIVGQVLAVQTDVAPLGTGAQVTNIVYMGMGEPLLNFAAVTQSARIFLHPMGMGFSSRRITLSTSGIVPRIRALGELSQSGELPLQLAISLNATTDAVRTQIMPINKKWPLAQLIGALRDYPLPPRRRFTIEYVLLGGLNDTLEDAKRLVVLLRDLPVKINLLPLNPHDRTPYVPPTAAQVQIFQNHLRHAGVHALLRTPRGQDIHAACGQLGGEAPGTSPLT